DLESAFQALVAERDGIFKDEKKAKAAKVELGTSRAALAELLERHSEWRGAVPELAALAVEEQAVEKEREHAGCAQGACAELLEARKENTKRAAAELAQVESALQALKRDLAASAGRIETLESDKLTDEDRARR